MTELINYPILSPNLKGYQHIDAIWFPFNRFTEQQCAKWIIRYWQPDCQLYLFEQGYLLCFQSTLSLYCDEIAAWPLVKQAGRLCSARLTTNEQQLLPKSDVILLQGQHIIAFNLHEGTIIEPAEWLMIQDYPLITVDSWEVIFIDPEYIDFTDEVKDFATILGDNIPKASPELLKYIQKKRAKNKKVTESSQSYSVHHDNEGNNPLWFLIIIVISVGILVKDFQLIPASIISQAEQSGGRAPLFIRWLFVGGISLIVFLLLLGAMKLYRIYQGVRATKTAYASAHKTPPPATKSDIPARQKQSQSKPQRWRNYFAHFAIFTKLHHLIKFRQGKYLESMVKMFEKGQLDEALRHAIPLDSANSQFTQQSFGAPKPRSKLTLSERYDETGSSIYLDESLKQHLKRVYLQAFDKLAKENRIEEAVFVMIELLNNLTEGIEYLEKQQRYQQALDIAIARDADVNIIVRLCCLTEQWDKAILFARRENAFANTIMLLQDKNTDIANELRVVWAQTLAEQSEWLAAIDVIWPLKAYRYLAEEWFEYAKQAEEFNADVMIKQLILQPEVIDDYQPYLTQLQENPELYANRVAIAVSLLKHDCHISKLSILLRPLLNVIIADTLEYPSSISKHELLRLIELSQDKVLKAELPLQQLVVKTHKPLSQTNKRESIICNTLGHREIYDTVVLSNGLYLLALGEAGIMLVDKRGKQHSHYMTAAHHFVLSHNKRQVLILAQRDNYYVLHKFDATTKQLLQLANIRLDFYLDVFDGIHWTVGINNHIQVLDIQKSLAIVWQVDLEQYTPIKFLANANQEHWLFKDQFGQLEEWSYALPERRLQYRNSVVEDDSAVILNRQYSGLHHFIYSEAEQSLRIKSWWRDYRTFPLKISKTQSKHLSCYVMQEFLALIIANEIDNSSDIYIYQIDNNMIKMTINWPAPLDLNAYYGEDYIIFYDRTGRCCHLDVIKNQHIYFTV